MDAVADGRVLYYQKNKISTIARGEEVQFLNSRSSAYFVNNIDNFWADVNHQKSKKIRKNNIDNESTVNDIMYRKLVEAEKKEG